MKAQDLKNSILQLAIQGKLVPQDPTEESAEVLYAKIQAEKARLVKAGKIKKYKPLPDIADEEKPFKIPKSWKWIRLGDIYHIIMGQAPDGALVSKVNHSNSFEFHQGKVFFDEKYLAKSDCYTTDLTKTAPKDSLLLCVRAPVGILNITKREICIGRGLAALIGHGSISSDFGFYFLQAYISDFIKKATGTTFIAITGEVIRNQVIPMPPLNEQRRIVTKILQLEPLVEAYGKAEEELTELNTNFPAQLRKSVLQYAVQGKLAPQDPAEEPAEVLLSKIKVEKEKLAKEGKIKKDKPLPPITDTEIPFPIPSTWKWVRLGEIVYNAGQKTPDKEFVYIDISSIDNKKNILGNDENVLRHSEAPSRARKIVEEGDIIYATVRPYLHNACIINKKFSREPIVSTGFAVLRTTNGVNNKYLLQYLLSPEFDSYANNTENSKGAAYPAINDKKFYNALVPLPPLTEQHRIVTNINTLLKFCDMLEHSEKIHSADKLISLTNAWLIDKGYTLYKADGWVNPNKILDELDIPIIIDRTLKKGRIEYRENKFQVCLNDRDDNWTGMHEIVHYVNHREIIQRQGAIGRKDETSLSKSEEKAIEELTAQALLPEEAMIAFCAQEKIKERGFVNNTLIRKAKKQFRLSSDYPVRYRLRNLGYKTT